MRENVFQRKLIIEIKKRFPDCEVLKNDSSYLQGVPDLLVLCGSKWAMLECKRELKSSLQPNQLYYIYKFDRMSYAKIVTQTNMEDVLDEMEHLFSS